MITKVDAPKHTIKDVYLKAEEMLAQNLGKMKGKVLNDKERQAIENIARVISNGVLKDMGVI